MQMLLNLEYDFFIAYADPDLGFAKTLYSGLTEKSRCFLAAISLRAGDDWDTAIPAALQNSRIIVILTSASTAKAHFERAEIIEAIRLSRERPSVHTVIPIQIDATPLPYGLEPKNALSLVREGGLPGIVETLLALLHNEPPTHPQDRSPKSLPSERANETFPGEDILCICEDGIPKEVFLECVSDQPTELQGNRSIEFNDGLVRLKHARSVPKGLIDVNRVEKCLDLLLDYIIIHKDDRKGASQVQNAIRLADHCADLRPKPVEKLFRTLEKFLKRSGKRRLVLKVANLTINASNRALKTADSILAEAQARICGRSWVYQRTGRIAEALLEANKSQALGEGIHCARNTAYCVKCRGRLRRIEAEEEPDPQEREALLQDSELLLSEAIRLFKKHPDFGEDHPEVGECYSLLGRTFLLGGKLSQARSAIKKADRLITDSESKEYMDLLILNGDLLHFQGYYDNAEGFYNEVVGTPAGPDAEKSEIRARALFRRAHNHLKARRVPAALADFDRAYQLWSELGENRLAALAYWETSQIENDLDSRAMNRLAKESLIVRLYALRSHKDRQVRRTISISKRASLPDEYWEQIIRRAQEQCLIEEEEW